MGSMRNWNTDQQSFNRRTGENGTYHSCNLTESLHVAMISWGSPFFIISYIRGREYVDQVHEKGCARICCNR